MKSWKVSRASGAAGGVSEEALVHLEINAKADTVNEIVRLVEAAPDLLEACKEMLATLEKIDFSKLPIEYDTCMWADWDQAISKATD